MVSGPLISGIAALIVGIIAIIIGVVISQSVKVAIKEGVEKQLAIDGPEDESYNPWVTNNLGGAAVATRSFYIYNISNINEVVKGAEPKYNEVGPYTYRYLYEKIDVDVSKENSTGFYRTYYRYVFQYDSKTGLRDTDELYQLNPNYIVPLYSNSTPDIINPVYATSVGIMAKLCAGVLGQLYQAFNFNGAFYNKVRLTGMRDSWKNYFDIIVGIGYGGNGAQFIADLNANDVIDLPARDCSVYPANLVPTCMAYGALSGGKVDIDLTGIPVSIRTELFSGPSDLYFGHASTIWGSAYSLPRPNNMPMPTLYMISRGITTSQEVKAIYDYMDRHMDGPQLALLRMSKGNLQLKYEDLGYAQYADLSTLSGLAISSVDPAAKFYTEFAAYTKFVAKVPGPYVITKEKAQLWLGNFTNPAKIGEFFVRLKAATDAKSAIPLLPVGISSLTEGQLFAGYLAYLYESVFLPVCAYTKTGLCLYRKTTVSNMLFGTMDDPMVTFLTQGASTRAGVFTNHTGYEAARMSSPFGDVVDVGTKEIDDVGKVLKINGANKIVRSDGKTNIWKKEVPITGRGAQFPPNSGSGYTQEIYSSALYRNLKLKKVDDQTVKGIKMRRFELDPANNAATAENFDTYFISQGGVMNYSLTEFVARVPNIPILATNPRLLDADQTLFTGIECTTSKNITSETEDCFVTPDQYNVRANRDQYTTQIYIEPITGLPMKGRSVVHFWLHITPQAKAQIFNMPPLFSGYATKFNVDPTLHPITTKPIPFCYLVDEVELTDKNAKDFKNTLYAAQDMGASIGVALPVIGAFLLVFSFALLYWHVKLVKEADSVGKA